MSKQVRFWVDPICPWCWVTARWAMAVAPERDLELIWKPISLLYKNDTQPDSPSYGPLAWTRDLLRVMEAVRADRGDAAIFDLYVEYGRRIHHDQQKLWDVALALEAVGLPASFAAAADDRAWDGAVSAGMDEGLALVGNEVGTPIIAWQAADGRTVAAFGPVITRVPASPDHVRLWDAFETVTTLPDFWEIKRTRTERPDFGARP